MLKPHEFLNLGKLWDTCVKHCFWGGGGVGHCDLKKPHKCSRETQKVLAAAPRPVTWIILLSVLTSKLPTQIKIGTAGNLTIQKTDMKFMWYLDIY